MVTNVDPSEREDFINILKQHKRSPDDFEVKETVHPMQGTGIQPMRSTITVTDLKSGTKRSYAAGHGTSWPAAVQKDIESGVFG